MIGYNRKGEKMKSVKIDIKKAVDCEYGLGVHYGICRDGEMIFCTYLECPALLYDYYDFFYVEPDYDLQEYDYKRMLTDYVYSKEGKTVAVLYGDI